MPEYGERHREGGESHNPEANLSARHRELYELVRQEAEARSDLPSGTFEFEHSRRGYGRVRCAPVYPGDRYLLDGYFSDGLRVHYEIQLDLVKAGASQEPRVQTREGAKVGTLTATRLDRGMNIVLTAEAAAVQDFRGRRVMRDKDGNPFQPDGVHVKDKKGREEVMTRAQFERGVKDLDELLKRAVEWWKVDRGEVEKSHESVSRLADINTEFNRWLDEQGIDDKLNRVEWPKGTFALVQEGKVLGQGSVSAPVHNLVLEARAADGFTVRYDLTRESIDELKTQAKIRGVVETTSIIHEGKFSIATADSPQWGIIKARVVHTRSFDDAHKPWKHADSSQPLLTTSNLHGRSPVRFKGDGVHIAHKDERQWRNQLHELQEKVFQGLGLERDFSTARHLFQHQPYFSQSLASLRRELKQEDPKLAVSRLRELWDAFKNEQKAQRRARVRQTGDSSRSSIGSFPDHLDPGPPPAESRMDHQEYRATLERAQQLMQAAVAEVKKGRSRPEDPETPPTPAPAKQIAKPEPAHAPERKEGEHKMRFWQWRYGKVVQHERGPIAAGSEHNITGMSTGVPRDLWPALLPSRIGIGGSDVYHWGDYPWREKGGGIVKKTVRMSGASYVVCARVNGRSETGEGVRGRFYTEARYWVIPEDQWSIVAVAQLADRLQAEPATAEEMERTQGSLEPVEMTDAVFDKPLPDGWFDDTIRRMIENLVAKRPLNLPSTTTSIQTYLEKLFYTLICLPENAAKKIDFGTGLIVGHYPHNIPMGLKVGGLITGREQLDPLTVNAYSQEVAARIQSCKTPREVMKAVQAIPGELLKKVEQNLDSLK
ncbi:hypothetical protein HYW17_00025 [Candidatus Uhrbacteria bacterium]|nr:hypothetical protein [Candidatus Uhrbacteria bacterium]